MKKVTSLLLLVGVAAFGLVACGDNVVPPEEGNVEGITVTPSTLNIAVGGTGSLSADVDGDPDNSVTWTSNNASVATVAGDGTVTGVSEGNAVVTATSTVDDAHSASAEINVTATEEAEVSIASITEAGGTPIDVNDVSGQINVTLNVSEGDQSIKTVDLLVDGEVASSQDFASASVVEGAEAQGEVSQITFNFRTDRAPADAEMDGTPIEGEFQNGERVISAQVTLSSGGTNSATNSQTLNFNNTNRVVVARFSGGQGVVGNGARYWGGEDVTIATTPITFTPLTVGEVTLDPTAGTQTANSGGAADIGGGAGVAVTDSEAPFQFTIALADNFGLPEDVGGAEDGPGGLGHDFMVTALEDTDGVVLPLGDFDIENLSDFFLDFVPPEVDAGAASEILIGGVDPDGSGQFFGDGDFEVSNLEELGVGGTNLVFNADDNATADDPDLADVVGIADLSEKMPIDFTTLLEMAADDLGNAADLTATIVDDAAADAAGGPAEDNESEGYGVDKTSVAITDKAPDGGNPWINPVDQGDGVSDNNLMFTANDPDLADGTTGSGYNTSTAAATAPDGTETTPTTAITPNAAGANEVDLDGSEGGGAVGTMDGQWLVEITTTDNALSDGNPVVTTYEYRIDATAPVTNMTNPPSSSVTSSNSTLTFSITGDASDGESGLSEVLVTVRETDPLVNDVCELSDPLVAVGSAAGEVDQNEVDVTADADDFSVDFTVQNAGAGTTQHLCFFIESADAAMDVGGDLEPNTSNQSAHTDVSWN